MASLDEKSIEVVVISLAESLERRAHAAAQLAATPFSWSFQDAIKGAALASFPEEYDRRQWLRFHERDMLPGQMGCFLSHREVWKKCVQTQKILLVLEDDFQFQRNISEVLPIAGEHLSHFDILRLQGLRLDWKYKVLKHCGKYRLAKHYHDPFGTTAYLLKPAAAKVLLEKSNPFHAHVDDFFGHDWIHRLEILSILPYPVKPSGMISTIGQGEPVGRSSRVKKWRIKIHKLRRSTAKRFYRMQTFPKLFFKRIK